MVTDSELPGSCPVKIHPSSCGTTTINGTVYAQVLKSATNENFVLPDIPEMKHVKNRLICKPPGISEIKYFVHTLAVVHFV